MEIICVCRTVGFVILAAVVLFPVVLSLPSPLNSHQFLYDIDIDGLDQRSRGSHHRQQRRSGRGEALETWDCGNVTQVPDDVRAEFPLDPFYQKYTHAYGIPILSSNVSQDAAVVRACYTVRFLLADRKDLRDAMYDGYGRVAVIAQSERTTEIPEHSYLDSSYDDRARGLGGTPSVPVSTDGEENLLCKSWHEDRWFEEDVLIHEFSHAIHLISLDSVDASFDSDLQSTYDQAVADGLWDLTYAISRSIEYLAEGVQAFFNVQPCRSFSDGIHNHVCTRDLLKDYDRRLYDLITRIFPCMNTVIDRCGADKGLAANQVLLMNCEQPTPAMTTLPETSEPITTLTPTTVVTTMTTPQRTSKVITTEVPTKMTTRQGTSEAITTATSTTEVTTTMTTPQGTSEVITTMTPTTEVIHSTKPTAAVTSPVRSTTDRVTTSIGFCPETTIVDAAAGSLTWPTTDAGSQSQSIEVCRLETEHAGLPRAARNCSALGPEWEAEYELRDCGQSKNPNSITVEDLAQVMVSLGNVVEVSQFLANLTSVDPERPQRPNLNLGAISKVLQNIVSANSGETKVANAVLQAVHNIIVGLSSGQGTGKDDPKSRSSIVKSLQDQVALTLRRKGGVSLRQESVQVQTVRVNRSEAVNGLGFASVQRRGSGDASVPGEVSLDETSLQVFVGDSEPSNALASVRLPGSELERADYGDSSTQPELRASVIVYRDDTLFPSTLKPGISVGGVVIAVTLQDVVLRNLADPVRIRYKTPAGISQETLPETKCVFWDFTLEEGTGDWSEDGCVLATATNEVIECYCDHLTNFAVLVGAENFPQALNAISQSGLAICIILLSLTLIAIVCSRPQVDKPKDVQVEMSRLIYMQLCVSLLALYVVFLAGIDGAKGSEVGCVFVAALLHYLTLVSVMLMIVDAWVLYRATKQNGPCHNKRFHILKDFMLAWGCPLLVTAITVPAEVIYYGINDTVAGSGIPYCFLKPGLVMYLGLLLPIGFLLVNNTTLCLLVARCCLKDPDRLRSRRIPQRLQNTAGIIALAVLTWLFGLLAITFGALAYHIMVLITAISQGVFMFVALFLRSSEARGGVLARLRCPKEGGRKQKYEVTTQTGQAEGTKHKEVEL